LGHPFRVHAAGVVSGIIGAGDGGLALKARILGRLAAQGAHIPSRLSGLALLVKAVARTLARETSGDDLPPEVGRRIEAQFLEARVGQAVEPIVEAGENGPHDPHQSLGG
jgi:hypothetical protein